MYWYCMCVFFVFLYDFCMIFVSFLLLQLIGGDHGTSYCCSLLLVIVIMLCFREYFLWCTRKCIEVCVDTAL